MVKLQPQLLKRLQNGITCGMRLRLGGMQYGWNPGKNSQEVIGEITTSVTVKTLEYCDAEPSDDH